MRESVFVNFDVDGSIKPGCFREHEDQNVVENLGSLIVEAFDLSHGIELHGLGSSNRSGGHAFKEVGEGWTQNLKNEIYRLAAVGRENWSDQAPMRHADPEERAIAFWAIHGLDNSETPNVESQILPMQIWGFTSLLIIDKALGDLSSAGLTMKFVGDLLHAAKQLLWANIEHRDDSIDYLNELSDSSIETGVARKLRESAIEKAKIRYAEDPKQKEKSFVKECWRGWQAGRVFYKGKAAFARDMLEKCEELESTKVIEDWCRIWEKEAEVGTLPAP
ncbi:hypothetical protein CR105_24530 [Massilia eurypsychrophila]|uniref:Uncharacterized protein n=1 Tax=Massilia eurypsychrophila TaxID=1485217 RepID=A0A2G8T8H5_9BURK|nr:hypothetical protein [Massilia eurypsychrophila]PIL42355.1 hypothetical protein CR105_24530 [Massilia eurypsychrophila]